MAIQPLYRSGPRSNATARRLIANSQQPAQHILNACFEDETIDQPIKRCRAQAKFIKGGCFVNEAQAFYLVRSAKWSHLYYVCIYTKEQGWRCSSSEPQVSQKCIEQAQAYKLSLLAAQQQQAA